MSSVGARWHDAPLATPFAAYIHHARVTRGLDGYRFGRLVGLTPTTINHWEGGRSRPSARALERTAHALKVDPIWLKGLADGEHADMPADEPQYERWAEDYRSGLEEGPGLNARLAEKWGVSLGVVHRRLGALHDRALITRRKRGRPSQQQCRQGHFYEGANLKITNNRHVCVACAQIKADEKRLARHS